MPNRWRNNNDGTTNYFTVDVVRPKLAGDYFDGAQTIDVHNHSRQGQGLGLELRKTKRWQIRFWQTFIGIIEVDAHNAYNHFKDATCRNRGFIKSVAMALVNNTRGGQELPLRPPRNLQQPAISAKKHVLASVASSKLSRRRKRKAETAGEEWKPPVLSCCVCHKRTVYYCVQCSDESNTKKAAGIFAVCGASARHSRKCFATHAAEGGAAAAGGNGGGGADKDDGVDADDVDADDVDGGDDDDDDDDDDDSE